MDTDFNRTLVETMAREVMAINKVFADHKIKAGIKLQDAVETPSYITYGLTLGAGTKQSAVTGLQGELSERLTRTRRRPTAIRFTKLPLALEVPHPSPIPLLISQDEVNLPAHCLLLGKSFSHQGTREEMVALTRQPHVLVAGTTGSGKSVLLRVALLSLCEHTAPDQVYLHLVDLKNEDAIPLRQLPHTRSFAGTLPEAEVLIAQLHALKDQRIEHEKQHLTDDIGPRHILMIDEFSELSGSKLAIKALSQIIAVGRSLKINVIAATQQPLVSVVSSILKANFEVRLVGKVTDHSASTVACGRGGVGAEFLPGQGSFLRITGPDITRFQTYYIPDEEVVQQVSYVASLYPEFQRIPSEAVAEADSEPMLPPIKSAKALRQELVERLASQQDVQQIFQENYDPDTKKLKYGSLVRLIEVMFGSNANSGGWNRSVALRVVKHLAQETQDGKVL